MDKKQMAFIVAAVIIFLVIAMLMAVLGFIGYLYIKSNPDTGNYNYSTYNGSTDVTLTPTPSATATPSPTPTPSPTATATPSPTATPTPTPTPTPSDCVFYEGESEHGAKVCGGKLDDPVKRHIWECVNGTWEFVESCSSDSTCTDSGCL